MDGIATQLFRFSTGAAPDRVWAALTSDPYLFGLAPSSDWRPGSAVVFAGEGTTLSGEVLAAEEPRRLSYSLRADEGQPETYATWEILGDGAGSAVLLVVDEPGEPEVEPAWREVVDRLESVLTSRGAAERL
ncbi:MAG TPA: SRPBCC domain-containing protein [Acidimicrobiales bacterium]|nr:SRPBCC domain-containing protein [Acidimicrobiales bacterium]